MKNCQQFFKKQNNAANLKKNSRSLESAVFFINPELYESIGESSNSILIPCIKSILDNITEEFSIFEAFSPLPSQRYPVQLSDLFDWS